MESILARTGAPLSVLPFWAAAWKPSTCPCSWINTFSVKHRSNERRPCNHIPDNKIAARLETLIRIVAMAARASGLQPLS